MNNELYAFALRNTITEIKNACPDVSHTFIFTDDGKLIAQDEDTDEETATRAAEAFNTISKGADTIGGLESVTFYGTSDRVNIFCLNDFYLAMVTSKEDDEKQSSTALARILVPTVLRLTEKIANASQEESLRTEKPEFSDQTLPDTEEPEADLQAEEAVPVEAEPLEEENEPDPLLPDPPVTQFMVENLGGLLVASDTVRIDSEVIQQWKDLYGDKAISEVHVETLNGQTTRCKFKPIKNSKQEGKGIIQLPQKIQRTLQASEGELVIVKPAID
jgi:predicted regulator of Ras-like GTPase activity (Roadblock/LC7/MglB family)